MAGWSWSAWRKPDNAYIAYPGTDLQIEVYDPKAGRAFELATAGAISRIN